MISSSFLVTAPSPSAHSSPKSWRIESCLALRSVRSGMPASSRAPRIAVSVAFDTGASNCPIARAPVLLTHSRPPRCAPTVLSNLTISSGVIARSVSASTPVSSPALRPGAPSGIV